MNRTQPSATELLKYSQQNHLIVSFRHIDHLLTEVEQMLECANSKCLFPRFVPDLNGSERHNVLDFVQKFRKKMGDSLQHLATIIPEAQVACSHAIETNLDYVDVAITEIRPNYMRAYGDVSSQGARVLNAVADALEQDLRAMLEHMRRRSAARE